MSRERLFKKKASFKDRRRLRRRLTTDVDRLKYRVGGGRVHRFLPLVQLILINPGGKMHAPLPPSPFSSLFTCQQ